MAVIFSTTATTTLLACAWIDSDQDLAQPKAPMAVSQEGNNNVYIVWWTSRSGNWEGMFRASTDGRQTFGDKINLSNSPGFFNYLTNDKAKSSQSVLRGQ